MHAQKPPYEILEPDYESAVKLYASGERDSAISALMQWDDRRLQRQVDRIKDSVVRIRSCSNCFDRVLFSKFPLRAALLLHADAEIEEQFLPPVSEHPPKCGIGRHSLVIGHLSAILRLVDPGSGAFVNSLHLGLAKNAQWSHCVAEALWWARAGLKLFPKDPELLMTVGIAIESSAFFTLPPAPTSVAANESSKEARLRSTFLSDLWEEGRRAFEVVLSVQPDRHEARLRLGRILSRLERTDAARDSLQLVLDRSSDHDQIFLAHLFLGRVFEQKSRYPEAETHYREAALMEPVAEGPMVALSHVRILQGDPTSAREILSSGLEAVKRRRALDPWMLFEITQTAEGRRILDGLWDEIAR